MHVCLNKFNGSDIRIGENQLIAYSLVVHVPQVMNSNEIIQCPVELQRIEESGGNMLTGNFNQKVSLYLHY